MEAEGDPESVGEKFGAIIFFHLIAFVTGIIVAYGVIRQGTLSTRDHFRWRINAHRTVLTRIDSSPLPNKLEERWLCLCLPTGDHKANT